MIGCSPITSKIYAGRVNNGLWMQKHDVTDSAPSAVAQHLLQVDQSLEFEFKGKRYKLQVIEIHS